MTFGERMHQLMTERGISLRALAKTLPCDVGYLSRISNDRQPPSAAIAQKIDTALGAGGDLAALRRPARSARTADSVKATTVRLRAHDWDEMERRMLLRLAALGVGAGALAGSGEPIRQLLANTFDSEQRDIADWYLTCADHLHAIRTRPPAQVRDALGVDLLAVQEQMHMAESAEVTELRRVVAMLGVLYANALTRLGDHGAAIHWWRTSRSAADASGDLDMGLMVRGEEAGFGLYGQRDPDTVITLLDRAGEVVGGPDAYWLADQKGTRAKALALLGRQAEAIEALRSFIDLASTATPRTPIAGLWKDDQIYFAESWVYACAGDEARADEARDRVLSYSGDYQYAANVRLHGAHAAVVNGGYETGIRQAVDILTALPPGQQSHMITHTAQTVLRAVPLDQHDRPAVRDLRALTGALLDRQQDRFA